MCSLCACVVQVRIFNNDYVEISQSFKDAVYSWENPDLNEEVHDYEVDNEVLHDAGWHLSLLKLPTCSGLWDDQNRDVSMMILNELIPMVFTSVLYYSEEYRIEGGRVDIVGRASGIGDMFHAMEIELGNSARSDSDILKLARIGEMHPHAELSIIAPSKKLLARWEKSTKSAETICKSLKRLQGIVKNVERINVIELCLPDDNIELHQLDMSELTTERGLFKRTKGVTKSDRRDFIKNNQSNFIASDQIISFF
jgi:hypothetical protein